MAAGEYRLTPNQARPVGSVPRRFGVMFSPSSSTSRFGIVDSGQRYEIQLDNAGHVSYSTDGGTTWNPIMPTADPDTGISPPAFLSFDDKRAGEAESEQRFDMLAVGRGRILAKQAGTDRLYHLVMDPLFRTAHVTGTDYDMRASGPGAPDPVVPAGYLKLDPEFYVQAATSPRVPPQALRNYGGHPASLRFPAFRELLQLGIADVALVLQHPRVWYAVDNRSPMSVIGPDDLKINDGDLRIELTQSALQAIALELYNQKRAGTLTAIRNMIVAGVMGGYAAAGSAPFTTAVRNAIGAKVPGWLMGIISAITGIFDSIARAVLSAVGGMIAGLITTVVDGVARSVFSGLIPTWLRQQINDNGVAGLLIPANVGVIMMIKAMWDDKALETRNGKLWLDPSKLMAGAGVAQGPALTNAIDKLRLRARTRSQYPGGPPPGDAARLASLNAPPDDVPMFEQVTYTPADPASGLARQQRFGIDYTDVLDLGVGYSHWSEHWQTHLGAEIHFILAPSPVLQQEGWNRTMYRMLNGPVVDGDGYNDGTCNFYMLVKLSPPFTEQGAPEPPARYAILWCDEQSYFTQRWRLLHPTADALGDMFSLVRSMKDHPDRHNFDIALYWSPFDDNLIDDASRMVVRRQLIAVTGHNSEEHRHEIYTTCFSWGVCDHAWRWRRFPDGEQLLAAFDHAQDREQTLPKTPPKKKTKAADRYVTVNTLDLRDDLTLHVRGAKRLSDKQLHAGRWVQSYLPADTRHVPRPHQLTGGRSPRGFEHPWEFFSEDAYRRADRYYQFGVYEDVINTRCQYYELELIGTTTGAPVAIPDVLGSTWTNEGLPGRSALAHNTLNLNWQFTKDGSGISVEPTDLIRRRRQLSTMSMYESTTRFRLLDRGPLGLIGVFFDKRDDELQPASDLPHEIVLTEEGEPAVTTTLSSATHGNAQLSQLRSIRVLVKGHQRVIRPPNVHRARLALDPSHRILDVSFWTPQSEQEVLENIWKVSLAALDSTGPVLFFSVERFGNFNRHSDPVSPPPFDFTSLDDSWRYDFRWQFDAAMEPLVRKYCTPDGRIRFGTSLWFEDVVGHCKIADTTEFV
jgi:hypothetical protein